jgi:ATP-dependent Clp protease ATP-binding subunit ClpC
MMRFDRFTERAQDAAMRAYEILQRYQHSQADTEHLLLALLEQTDGLIPQILESLGVNSELAQQQIEEVLQNSPKTRMPDMGPMAVGQVYITLSTSSWPSVAKKALLRRASCKR